ncbi:putative spermatogenesis-associated protein 17-like [Trypanosoma rangeli]|uniref:Putative spermatogenesis-associated protein 17-like n=1 Tax=Trypanosoma rangeli TaxID=5698 RepID=A0A3R7LXQ7_TRYRA|nr:putative spermatogenesis-associated protein 17-like [Trypanosoma rangeli]RNE95651.1 putative spermatogenesis-associated protein 17-like [Trypanosoma rangeli]|eukprot:RNE95651.1 putative spermatogenesis-associated protein 17-like [Trypanosoma rangeli]
MSTCSYIQPIQPQLVSSLMGMIADAYDLQQLELCAARTIQSAYRMWRQYGAYRVVKRAVVCLQRVYRGHMQRKRAIQRREQAEEAHERAVYEYYATRIQACFRGYYVRSHMDNFYARKLYIEETVKASLQVQEMATQLFHEQVERDTETRRLQQEKSYKEATEKLRHLVSTVSVSGIYRRPMVPCLTMSVYGTCVEDDIRRNGEAALHLEHIRKMRGTLTTGRRERQKTGVASATTKESGFPTNKQVQGGVGAKGQGNVSTLPVLRVARNWRARKMTTALPTSVCVCGFWPCPDAFRKR